MMLNKKMFQKVKNGIQGGPKVIQCQFFFFLLFFGLIGLFIFCHIYEWDFWLGIMLFDATLAVEGRQTYIFNHALFNKR